MKTYDSYDEQNIFELSKNLRAVVIVQGWEFNSFVFTFMLITFL